MENGENSNQIADSEELTERNAALGRAVATARSMIGYSIDGAAEALGIDRAILRDVESGHVVVNTALRLRVEQCFGIKLEDVLVERKRYAERKPLEYDQERGVLRVGKLGVAFRKGVDSNDDLLRGFSAAIRSERRLTSHVPLRLRTADLPILAQLVDLEDPELDERAQFWFGQTPETKQGFTFLLRTARDGAALKA